MPTIKTKKEMNLGELICWAIDNKKQARFRDFSSKSMRVRFNDNAKPEIIFAKQFLPIEQTFKVQIEEEITEDTVIPKIAELNLCGYDQHEELFVNENKSIKQLLSEVETNNKAFYIMNDDMSMTLIWRDGKLVE